MDTTNIDKQHIPIPTTSLVGREEDVARLMALLQRPDARLVTLLGPGGIGKTRLTLQIAHSISPEIANPVRMVMLANTTDPDDILPAIARSIGAVRHGDRPLQDEIAESIGEEPMLLILDNVEQIVPHLTFLSGLLSACPRLTVMATSRVMLRLSAEHVFAIEPLPTKSPAEDELAPASALFVDRARAVNPALDLSAANIAAIDEMCRMVDGLPLTIELAAARTRFLSPVDLRERLTERLSMLTGGPRDAPERHRTLRATLAWSHDLLTAEERMLFRRLAIATDGIPYDAVEPICNATGDLDNQVDDLLSALVDHSLVRIDTRPETGPRVRLLHTIREFAQEHLVEAGELETIQRAHAMWYARMVIDTPQSTWGTGRTELREWTLRHLPDLPTFSTVLKRLMDWGETTLATEMTAPLGSFWNEVGQMREARAWWERVMPHLEETPPETQAELLFKAATIAHGANQLQEALDFGKRSLRVCEAIGSLRWIANVQNLIGNLYWDIGEPEQGERFHRLAIATTEEDNSPIGTAMFKAQLAERLVEWGDYETAEQLHDEAEPIVARERADAIPLLMGSRAMLYLKTARLDESGKALERALEFYHQPPHRRPDMLALNLMIASELAGLRGMHDDGARLMGSSKALVDEIGLSISESSRKDVTRIETGLREQLGDTRYEHLEAGGWQLMTPDAIELALTVARKQAAGEPEQAVPVPVGPALTRREWEVLQLLVEGKPNSAIADALYISERTVTTHLTHLYGKLEVSSRAEAISMALRMGLVESA